jgi:release factor glutamine methyltransferase
VRVTKSRDPSQKHPPPAPPCVQGGETVRAAIAAGARRLEETSDTPRLDAELLMAHALGVEREDVLLRHLDAFAPADFERLLARRASGEPVAYITGWRDFWTIRLQVGPGALVPRPDSETLVEAAVAHFGTAGPRRVMDLGTGPGTLLLAALTEWPEATGLGVDTSEPALAYARRNAGRLGLAERVELRTGDWGEGIVERFDLVLCNPPYVEEGAPLPRDVSEWEPHAALFAGPEGLDAYPSLAPHVARLLARGGVACVELGAGQLAAVAPLFTREGLAIASRKDLGGRDRCLIAKR